MKARAHLSMGVQEETGIQTEEVEVNLTHVREIHGHQVANVTLAKHNYLARTIAGLSDENTDYWAVDTLKHVY